MKRTLFGIAIGIVFFATPGFGPLCAQDPAKPTDAHVKVDGPRDSELRKEYEALGTEMRTLRLDNRDALSALDVRVTRLVERLREADPRWAADLAVRWGVRLQRNDPGRGLVHVETAIEIARAAGDDRGVADLLIEKGRLCSGASRYREALTAYDQAAAFYEKAGDDGTGRLADIILNRGSVFGRLGRYEEAVAAYDEAARMYEEAGNEGRLADIAVNRGTIFLSLSRHEEALAAYDQAARFFEKAGDEGRLATIAMCRGNGFRSLCRYEEALAAYDQAARYFEKAGDKGRLATIAMNRGIVFYSTSSYEEAIAAYKQAAKFFEQAGDEGGLADIAQYRGNVFCSMSRFEEGLAAYDRAARFFEQAGDEGGLARIAMCRGNVFQSLSHYEEALAAYDQAARFYDKVGDEGGLAAVAVNRGNVFLFLSHYEEALAAYDQAAKFFVQAGNEGRLATIAMNRGNVFSSLSRYEEALGVYDQAARFFEQAGDEGRLASIAMNRGVVFEHLSRYEEAFAVYDQAARFFEKAGDEGRLATIANGRGNVFESIGRHEEALTAYDQAARFFERAGDEGRLAIITMNRGIVFRFLSRYEEALAAFHLAAKFFEQAGNQGGIADIATNRGIVFDALTRYEEALAAYDQAARFFEQAGDEGRLASIASNRGSVFYSLRRYEEGLAAYDQAARFFEQAGDDERLAGIAMNRGNVFQLLNRHEEAFRAYRQCAVLVVSTLQSQVQKLGDASSSALRSKFRSVVARTLASCRELVPTSPDALAAAYEVTQAFHGLGLAEQLAERAALGANAIPEELRKEHSAALARLYQAVARRDAVTRNDQRLADAAAEVHSRERELNNVIERARLRSRVYVDLAYPKPSPLTDVQAELGPGVALVEYAIGDEDTWAMVTTKDRCQLVKLGDPIAINSDVDKLAGLMGKGRTPRVVELRTLAEKVLDPVLAVLGKETKTLLFAPNGALCRLPFEVLLTSTPPTDASLAQFPFLISSYDVGYVHSGTVLVAMRKDARERQRPADGLAFVGIGHPFDAEAEGNSEDAARPTLAFLDRERGGRGPLPGSALEALSIALQFASGPEETGRLETAMRAFREEPLTRAVTAVEGARFRVWLRDGATEHTLEQDPLIRNARIVHLACHAEADLTSPSLSRLVLSRAASIEKASGEDGYVYVRDVRDLNLDCDLLVLSACESTLGKLSAVDGMTGLARAGLAGGAKAVLSTLWRVTDRSAQDFMVSFYGKLGATDTTRLRALSNAKREAITKNLPIRTWSAYVLWDADVAR